MTIKSILERLFILRPAPTPQDLWRAARIEHARAKSRGDTRAMGQSRKAMRVHAHDALRMELRR